jgi:hypothetical protein
MSFDNSTNHKRVQKIVEITQLLATSASSNKASEDEIWTMLQPALDSLSELCGANTEAPSTQDAAQPSQTLTEPRWASIRKMAEEAPLMDLTFAMAVFLSRIDEHLSKKN